MNAALRIPSGKSSRSPCLLVVCVLKRKRELNTKFIWGRHMPRRSVNQEGKKHRERGVGAREVYYWEDNIWTDTRSWGQLAPGLWDQVILENNKRTCKGPEAGGTQKTQGVWNGLKWGRRETEGNEVREARALDSVWCRELLEDLG